VNCVICNKPVPKPKRGPVGKTCSNACKQKLYRAKPVTPQTQTQKTRNTPVIQAYTASNIRILSGSERFASPAFDWGLAEDLAHEFNKPVEWIERSIRACREAGVSPQYFIDRYLKKLPISIDREVDECSREIQKELMVDTLEYYRKLGAA
jgi:hypothetical protein